MKTNEQLVMAHLAKQSGPKRTRNRTIVISAIVSALEIALAVLLIKLTRGL